jgi:hypothetical protein
MFNTISWQSYWTAIAIATSGYYLLVYLVYFKRNGGMIFQNENQTTKAFVHPKEDHQPSLFDNRGDNLPSSPEKENEQVVYACMDELNAFFENQKRTKAVKSELMFGLHTILQKYPSLRNSDYKESLTNVIATQSENICSIHLSAEELKGVWFG